MKSYSHWFDYFRSYNGPFSILRECKICGHIVTKKKERQGMAGRGWGMREGNKLNSLIISHIKENHNLT